MIYSEQRKNLDRKWLQEVDLNHCPSDNESDELPTALSCDVKNIKTSDSSDDFFYGARRLDFHQHHNNDILCFSLNYFCMYINNITISGDIDVVKIL